MLGNESEAEAFARANNFGTVDRTEIAKKIAGSTLIGHKSRVVVITQGSDDVIVVDDAGKVSKVATVSVDKNKVIKRF